MLIERPVWCTPEAVEQLAVLFQNMALDHIVTEPETPAKLLRELLKKLNVPEHEMMKAVVKAADEYYKTLTKEELPKLDKACQAITGKAFNDIRTELVIKFSKVN